MRPEQGSYLDPPATPDLGRQEAERRHECESGNQRIHRRAPGGRGSLHHPRQVRLWLLVWPRRLVVGAGEGEEGIGAVRAVVMAGTVLPDAVVVVPFLAVVTQALEAEVTG